MQLTPTFAGKTRLPHGAYEVNYVNPEGAPTQPPTEYYKRFSRKNPGWRWANLPNFGAPSPETCVDVPYLFTKQLRQRFDELRRMAYNLPKVIYPEHVSADEQTKAKLDEEIRDDLPNNPELADILQREEITIPDLAFIRGYLGNQFRLDSPGLNEGSVMCAGMDLISELEAKKQHPGKLTIQVTPQGRFKLLNVVPPTTESDAPSPTDKLQ